ncbi:hypothetical protein CRG98_044403 [Punica granatum]|uniref:Uncharacterized protein n=1 Tax=Punica granatum TaxID=22663 RepID=A0A2I0HU48_PUNGR|nr:hypothetical protein CRG98_044403 [Punica granatum]
MASSHSVTGGVYKAQDSLPFRLSLPLRGLLSPWSYSKDLSRHHLLRHSEARGPIYDVSVADIRQVGHVDWPGSSSANDTSIPKPPEYLFERRLYLYGEFAADIYIHIYIY